MTYKVWVCLEAEYDDIEADSEEEAFLIASEAAMGGGDWNYRIEKQEEEKDDEEYDEEYEDFPDDEVGFNPYEGAYDYDC